MTALPQALRDHLAQEVTSVCFCWIVRRKDGAVLGFTEHARDLVFDGTTFEAAAGITASALESTNGLNVDNLDVTGALSSARLDEGDLAAGLYDDAEIEIWRVNWQDAEARVLMRKGNLGEVSRSGAAFTAELRGLAHRLNQPTGRLYQYGCDADFADARCGLDAADWTAEGIVTGASGNREMTSEGLDGFAAGHFTRGLITFTSGANEGASMEVKAHASGGTLELWRAMARDIAPGNTFTVTAGCDKQFETCRLKFANRENFRGFPHMPGSDFVIARAGS